MALTARQVTAALRESSPHTPVYVKMGERLMPFEIRDYVHPKLGPVIVIEIDYSNGGKS